uniref:EF-hand domain-containing protein n=1 Tax=Tetradesmus obliquus TaxID=3088 RepID=A0A383W633_TETOB
MPVQLERQQRESGLLVKERASFSKSQKCSGPYSGWVEPDSNVAVLTELVTAASARDRATTATPISEACSRRLLRHGERPRSCPGGRVGGTSGVPAGTTSSRRLTNVGGKASEASPGSAQGLGVYCSSLELAVGKKLHGRHGSSSKRASSASSASEQAGSLPAWNPSASKAAGKGSSGSGSHAAGATSATSSTDGAAGEKLSPGTGRAVGLALSLRERVMQLEKRNRALEKKLKSLSVEETAQQQQDNTAQQPQGTCTSAAQQQQQQQQRRPAAAQARLQVCLLHTADVPASSKRSVSSSCSSTAAASSTAPAVSSSSSCSTVASVIRRFEAAAEDSSSILDVSEAADCSSKEQHSAAAAQKQQQQQQPQHALEGRLHLQPPRTPDPCETDRGRRTLRPRTPPSPAAPAAPPAAAAASAAAQAEHAALLQREQQHLATIGSLQRQLAHAQMLHGLLASDYADLEYVLKETERQRREYAARYAFVCLDGDGDGYLSVEQVEGYDLFSCYAPRVLHAAFAAWRWASGFPGFLNIDDFVRFVEYAEDRGSAEAQRFWFSVLDADGDGRLSWQDMRLAYEAVDKSSARYVVSFEDLMNQIRDMVGQQQQPALGFTCAELRASKLGSGVLGLLTNHNNMLLQRSTAEWGRGEYPL